MNMQPTVVALVLLLSAGAAQAQVQQTRYKVYGTGNTSCAMYAEAQKNTPEYFQYASWILGYVSAAGLYSVKELPPTESDPILATALLYCQQHPMAAIADAGEYAVQQLRQDGQ